MILTHRQQRTVDQLIHDHHLAFLVEMCGTEAVAADELERLHKAGLILEAAELDIATAAHVAGAVRDENSEPERFWQISDHFAKAGQRHLSQAEREAIQITRAKIGEHIKDLGRKLSSKTGQVLVAADEQLRRKRLATLRRQLVRGVKEKLPVEEIAENVRRATKDSSRDWIRIVRTEMHNALEEGKATALLAGLPANSDPLVFKRPLAGACVYCRLLYLKPDGITPRLFRLSKLTANGSNVGRKAGRPSLSGKMRTEWKAVLGAVHPACRCGLYHLPAGMMFDKKGRLVHGVVHKSEADVFIETIDRRNSHG